MRARLLTALFVTGWRAATASWIGAALAALIVSLLAATLGYYGAMRGPIGALSGVNAILYDLVVAAQRKDARDAWPDVFVLLVDQATLAREPWSQTPRALQHPHLARVGREALDLGARKVAFDLVLAVDPATVDIGGARLSGYDASLRDFLRDDGQRVVLGAYPTFQPAGAYVELVGAAHVGLVDLQEEEDGAVRSVATRVRLADRMQLGFAQLVALPVDGPLTLPARSHVLLFPRASLSEVPHLSVDAFERCVQSAEGRARLSALIRGRNVLIGAGIIGEDARRGPDRFIARAPQRERSADPCAAQTSADGVATATAVPGVFVQAGAVQSALSTDTPALAPPMTRAGVNAAVALFSVLLFYRLTRRLNRLPARRPSLLATSMIAFFSVLVAIAGLFVFFLGVEIAAVGVWRLWIPLGHTLVFVGALGLLGTMTLAVRRDLALADLRISFGRYLAPNIVSAALERNETLGGEERSISVMIADLRGFTAFCEARRDAPGTIIHALNEKFGAAQTIIDRYEGCVDKFDGDSVIAFWNGVGDQPDHAARALCAAIEIVATDGARQEAELAQLRFKAAVATGFAFVGSYGSRQKMSFSAIGEPMNVAARLERLCNDFGVPLLATKASVDAARMSRGASESVRGVLEGTRFKSVGPMRLRGAAKDVEVMTIEGETKAAQ